MVKLTQNFIGINSKIWNSASQILSKIGRRGLHNPKLDTFFFPIQKSRALSELNFGSPTPMDGILGILTHSQNAIGARILAKTLSRVTAQECTEDPYFICDFLSIAQLQKRYS